MSVHDVIQRLPDVQTLRSRSQALAALDAILCPEERFRTYTFRIESQSEATAEMRDGAGGEYSIHFSGSGAFARGFDHESPMSPYRVAPPVVWPNLDASVPAEFAPYLGRRVVDGSDSVPLATVLFWSRAGADGWETGDVLVPDEEIENADGAELLFSQLIEVQPEVYVEYAEDCFEFELDPKQVEYILRLEEISRSMVSDLNPDANFDDLVEDFRKIGFPYRD
nr:hypothetical protein OG781_31445 [Streptomyces sp. NBC_00830]